MSVTLEDNPARYVYVDGLCVGYFIYLKDYNCIAFRPNSDQMMWKRQDLADVLDLLDEENSKL